MGFDLDGSGNRYEGQILEGRPKSCFIWKPFILKLGCKERRKTQWESTEDEIVTRGTETP
jgi:hypothetical protein